MLERRPDEISLLQIIEAIEGPLNSNLPIGDGLPPLCQEQIRAALKDVTSIAREKLDAIKLSSLLSCSRGGKGESLQVAEGGAA